MAGANALSYEVQIGISCKGLINRDLTSKSDPMCILFCGNFGEPDQLTEVGRTESIKDCLSPDFAERIVMLYKFEEQQKLKFALYDKDSSGKLSDQDYLGYFDCTLAEIVSCSNLTRNLSYKEQNTGFGTITVRCESVNKCSESLNLTLSAANLDKKDVIGKSDPFIIIKRGEGDTGYSTVYQTEVIKNDLNPNWRPFSIHLTLLCNGDKNRQLLIECYDYDKHDDCDLIGSFVTTTNELAVPGKTFELINAKKRAKKKKYTNSGVLRVDSAKFERTYTFLDYIQSGCQVNFTVAVDFTASNGNQTDPSSLHYLNSGYNQYTAALHSVGAIISDYDSDKMFPALGFGGKLPDGNVSHEFFLNLNPSSPFCSGIDGVMQAYRYSLEHVTLWGPTNFSPVINHVTRFAEAIRDGSNYFVLLIITDGAISDMENTKRAIINASRFPVSIIIVGVGDADFDSMEELDCDKGKLRSGSMVAERDIVQFVAMNDYDFHKSKPSVVQAMLAKAVLAEVPKQFLSYMNKYNIKPRNAQAPAV